MDDNLLKLFIAVTAFAVLLQALIMVALYLAIRKSTARMEALATEVRNKALPVMESAQSATETVQNILVELRPKIDAMSVNFAESSDAGAHINLAASTPRSPMPSTAPGCKSSAPMSC